jgi:ABC-type dipeptide/oligopeptide/nickel transport system permease subunit
VRVVRALVASLRQQEFVEAAHMVGARDPRVIRRELLPHLTGPLIAWETLVAAGVIVLEASLSILNFGVLLGTASWGSMLAQTWGRFSPTTQTKSSPFSIPNANASQGRAVTHALPDRSLSCAARGRSSECT